MWAFGKRACGSFFLCLLPPKPTSHIFKGSKSIANFNAGESFKYFKMFEARIVQGQILKKIIEAIRELVTDANLDCNEEQGISMQVREF
jgi:hypothetical protein